VTQELHNAILSSLDLNIAILDGSGVIVDVNESWRRFGAGNGGSNVAVIGQNYFDVCRRAAPTSPDARKVLEGMLAVCRGETPRFQYGYRCDAPDEPRWYVLTVVPLAGVDQGLVVVHQNNTETQLAVARYGELLDSVRAIIWRAEAPGFETTFASRQAIEILGFPADAWAREPRLWQQQIHPDDRDWALAFSSKAVQECRDHTFEYRMIAADRRIVWLRNIVKVIAENGAAQELVGVSIDITDRKRAEETRDEFARALLSAHEQERAFIARELHDDLGQTVALLAVKLAALCHDFEGAAEQPADVAALGSLVDKVAIDLRRVSHGLHPSSLDLLGLGAAIRQLCDELEQHHAISIHCEVQNIPRDLDRAVAMSLYRVGQECLRNVLKHSQATAARVHLSRGDGDIRLQISDDGIGFEPSAAIRTGGLGLASMAERLRLVRGTFVVTSSAGEGTWIEATVPLR
jgi:PAS domain S-box-containing protein